MADLINKLVKVDFEAFVDDGTPFDSTAEHNGKPLSWVVAGGRGIPALDMAVRDMEIGDTKTVHISAEEAGFGEYDPEDYQEIPITSVPNGELAVPGKSIYWMTMEGMVPVTILDVSDGIIKVDMNHPLAGHGLDFTFTLLSVEDNPLDTPYQGPTIEPELEG